jgi:hypothetical protein
MFLLKNEVEYGDAPVFAMIIFNSELNKRMSLFAKQFMKVLKEDSADMERRAMEASLDDGTDPTDFDVDTSIGAQDGQTSEVADAMSRRNQQIVQELQGWIDEIDGFLKFLNSEDPNSIQSKLAAAEADTIMDKMKQSQQSKISRVASDLASLHQNFLGFMSQTQNSRFKYVAWAIFSGLSFLTMNTHSLIA